MNPETKAFLTAPDGGYHSTDNAGGFTAPPQEPEPVEKPEPTEEE